MPPKDMELSTVPRFRLRPKGTLSLSDRFQSYFTSPFGGVLQEGCLPCKLPRPPEVL